jgi:DNA-binding response OmpR family regulator
MVPGGIVCCHQVELKARKRVRTLPEIDQDAEQKLKVVVLCLEEHYRTTLAHWLLLAGMDAVIAESGRRARVLLAAGGTQVLVTDRVLPPWPGLPRLSSLRRSDADLRIVAIDRGDPDSRYVALAAGADAVVSPPLRRDEVMRAIHVARGSG